MISTLLFEYEYKATGGDVTEVIEILQGDDEALQLAADRAMTMAASEGTFAITYPPAQPVTAFASDGQAVRFDTEGGIR